jgi:hypothetical protein
MFDAALSTLGSFRTFAAGVMPGAPFDLVVVEVFGLRARVRTDPLDWKRMGECLN